MEQRGEWAESHRYIGPYIGPEILAKIRAATGETSTARVSLYRLRSFGENSSNFRP